MKMVFVNIDKKENKKILKDTKYILITNSFNKIKEYESLKIKPIVILYNGAYVIDLEKNSVIINKPVDKRSLNNIINYSNTHNVSVSNYKNNDMIYELKLSTSNYHRRLIIPYMFREEIPNVKCVSLDKDIYIINNDVSLLNAICEVFNYLNVNNNIIDLENIYTNISYDGYIKDKLNWKGYELYES